MLSDRLKRLPPYLFVEIDRKKADHARSGRELLDLGIGDPDLGPPGQVLDSLIESLGRKAYHMYPDGRGLPLLIEAIRGWARDHHGARLDPEEILVTIGSKEAIGHLPLAVADPGSVVLVPDPGYPVYYSSAVFAGAEPVRFPLTAENGFLPDLGSLDEDVLERAVMLYMNYPNNPTSAVAGEDDFAAACEVCSSSSVILVNDAAYSEISYDGRQQALFPIARESGTEYLELFSFSKTFSITGWRIGFAIGSPGVVSALARLKSNLDSGVFSALQAAVASALERGYERIVSGIVDTYRRRRDSLAGSLGRGHFVFEIPEATFYIWVEVPGGGSSIDFCGELLERTGIVATPGVGFGEHGEGYFRLSLTAPEDTILRAGKKLEELGAGT
jgi:LL-diaminopimelate aminotransferase